MTIASHNTFTYRKPQWWCLPLFWMSKCQSRDYKEQYKRGARYFDIRLKIHNGKVMFGHTICSFNADDLNEILLWMRENAYGIRVTLEGYKTAEDREQFLEICSKIEEMGINAFGGYSRKDNWAVIYSFKKPVPYVIDGYSTGDEFIFDDWFPWLWDKIHRKGIVERYKSIDCIVALDFI